MTHTAPLADRTPQAITARLDRFAHLTRGHKGLVVFLAPVFFFDVFDLSSFAYTAPALMVEWQLSIETIGVLSSAVFLGMFLGGVVGGRLADRFGRRPLILVGVTVFSAASLLTAFAPNPVFFGIVRVITGFGLQMAMTSILVIISESFPKSLRGRVMSIVLAVGLLTGPVLALAALILVPRGLWQVIFLFGGLGLLLAVIGYKVLPESPRWLALHGRADDADAALQRYEQQYLAAHGALPEPVLDAEPEPAEDGGIVAVFRRNLLGRTMIALVAFIGLILVAAFQQWLPTILVESGYPQGQALTLTFVLAFGGVAGSLLSTLFIDRIDRKVSIALVLTVMAAAFVLLGFVGWLPVLLAAGLVVNASVPALSAAVYSYVPELYPLPVRGAGVGLSQGTGRVAGIFSGMIVAAVIAGFGTSGLFLYFALVAVVTAVIIAAFGPRR